MTPPSDRSEPWPRAIGCALTGQDTARATFGHRHAVRHDREDGGTPLSEVGVLGFEDGYSLDRPDGLIHAPTLAEALWEAALAVDGHLLHV
jgi:2-oxoglutarate dehydrogenase complex dehydrogenase (E1) component-like enzyme